MSDKHKFFVTGSYGRIAAMLRSLAMPAWIRNLMIAWLIGDYIGVALFFMVRNSEAAPSYRDEEASIARVLNN